MSVIAYNFIPDGAKRFNPQLKYGSKSSAYQDRKDILNYHRDLNPDKIIIAPIKINNREYWTVYVLE